MMRRLAALLLPLGLLRGLLVGGTAAGQGFPFPTPKTRTPTRTPTITPTRTPAATPPDGATPSPTPPPPTITPTRPPSPPATANCVVAWPTRNPGNEIHLEYRWTGHGACFSSVASDRLGPEADVFLSVNGSPERQLRWQMAGCWVYADDGTVPYALPVVGAPPVRFMFTVRKGTAVQTAGADFFPPSYVPPL